jgi:hypothetical protein
MSESLAERLRRDGLPAPAADRVAASVREACLSRSDEEDVARELTAHFEDGLARGRSLEDLVGNFGEPAMAGALIGRGIRRRRQPARQALRLAEIFALLVLSVYLISFARLHLREPEASADAAGDWRIEALAPWSQSAPALAEPAARGWTLVAAARDAARAGDRALAAKNLNRALDVAREIATGPHPAHDLAALRLAAETLLAAKELPGGLGLRAAGIAWRPEKVRAAFADLLASMYTRGEEGRLTASGLRIYQASKGKTAPGLLAIVLEPAYFPYPASRPEVSSEFDRFLELAADDRQPAFERERRHLASSAWRSLRFVALVIPLDYLASVREASRSLERAGAVPAGRS